jgi:hypothetical protein
MAEFDAAEAADDGAGDGSSTTGATAVKTYSYRITGPQSVERLTPLLENVFDHVQWRLEEDSSRRDISFVWETACPKSWDEAHKTAFVLDRLSNSQIIEDKANLAYLQHLMDVPVLDTYLASNAGSVLRWANCRWCSGLSNMAGSDWWAVKASRGNGGKDVWFINASNFAEVASMIPQQEEYVIQRYVPNPLLWKGTKKFHFRCYGTLHADMSALLYRHCYVLSASEDYDTNDVSSCKHITNLSVNKHSPGHPGQVPCAMAEEFPVVSYFCLIFVWQISFCLDSYSASFVGCGHQ